MQTYKDLEVVDNKDGTICITNIHGFSLDKTLKSGQCFRYEQNGAICTIQSEDMITKVIQKEADKLLMIATKEEAINYWIPYLNIEDNYDKLISLIADNEFLIEAERFSRGIKIMKQKPWEALVCFIISQRNNIPKITSTVAKLCKMCGNSFEFMGKVYYTFPTPQELLEGLNKYGEQLSLGYRLPYLEYVAKEVINNRLNLEDLRKEYNQALTELESLYGVGPKVANCVALFGLGYTSAFPVDVWIQRVIDEYFNGCIDISKYGEYAGIVQQYMFFYGKHLGK